MVTPPILRVLNPFLLEWVPVMLMANGEHPDVYVHFETQAKKQIKAKNRFSTLTIGGYHVNFFGFSPFWPKPPILVRKSRSCRF